MSLCTAAPLFKKVCLSDFFRGGGVYTQASKLVGPKDPNPNMTRCITGVEVLKARPRTPYFAYD